MRPRGILKCFSSDKWQVTSDKWQVTSDNWQLTTDNWHVTCNNIFVTYHVIYFRIPWDSRSILKCLKSDMWQVTSEKWHMTSHKWHVNFVLLFISCHIFSGKIYLTIIYFNPPLLPFTLGSKTLGPKTLNIWVSILNNLMGYMRLKFLILLLQVQNLFFFSVDWFMKYTYLKQLPLK